MFRRGYLSRGILFFLIAVGRGVLRSVSQRVFVKGNTIFFNRSGTRSSAQCFAEGIRQLEYYFFNRSGTQRVFVLGRLIAFFVRNLMVVRYFYNPLATLRTPFFKLFTLKLIRRPSLHLDNFR